MGVETIVTVVVAIFASTGFWTFINNRMSRKDQKEDETAKFKKWREGADKYHEDVKESIDKFKEQMDLQSEMLMGLGHDRILQLGEKYIAQGSITLEEYEDLDKYLYRPYAALGGNGTAKKIMEEIKALPTRTSDSKEDE